MIAIVFSRRCIAAALVCLVAFLGAAWAEEGTRVTIPFKTEPTPIESHGENLGIVVLLLLVGAGGVLYYVRRKLPHMQLGLKEGGDGKRVFVLEKTRLGPRSTLYLVRVNGREVLIGQCGDTLSMLDATGVPADDSEGGKGSV